MFFVPQLPAAQSLFRFLSAITRNWFVYLYVLIAVGFFAYFWANSTYTDEFGNFFVTHISLWGDWAVHFTMGSAMAYRKLFLITSPLVYGAQFNYPFVANMISALLIKAGGNFFLSFVIPSFIFCVAFVLLLPTFYWRVFSKNSALAILAATIFLLNGGTGFIQYFQDISESPTPWKTALNPPVEYTHLSDKQQIHWISVINSQIIPQRALTLGVPTALVALTLVYTAWFTRKRTNKKLISWAEVAGAMLYGLLPIIHAHSFIAVTAILGCWSLGYLVAGGKKHFAASLLRLGQFFVLSAMLAIPLLLEYVISNAGKSSFIKWHPGWYQRETPDLSIFVFWFRNWSLTPLLALIGFLYGIKKSQSEHKLQFALTFLPFFVLFVLANLFLFQPHAWDNTKIFLWVSVGFSALAALVIQQIFRLGKTYKLPLPLKLSAQICAVLLLVSVTITGAIDNWRILRFDLHTYQMYSAEERALAEWVKQNTPTDATWMTGDQHNHWLYNLTGRQPLLVFRGWLWTHGYDYAEVESDLSSLYTNPGRTDLIEKYNVQYAVVGPNERDVWKANEPLFQSLHTPKVQLGDYTIYSITRSARY